MSAPTWIDRVSEITAVLKEPTSPPLLDRAAIEELFHLKRRQAIDLMHQIKGYRLAKALVVDRSSLLQFLRDSRGRSRQAIERKSRVSELLAEARQDFADKMPAVVSVPVAFRIKKDVYQRRLSGLPEGIDLTPGRLTITFAEPAELLQKLFELGQALANDYQSFEAAVTANPLEPTSKLKKNNEERTNVQLA